ncbi:MAG TPA: hypothetical protein VFZ21_13680 [Gemmatimonadaceae bacterium]|jgi:hypothetical protein|nr:hypothetical protein [Gemmatimonadaceae bacterium]
MERNADNTFGATGDQGTGTGGSGAYGSTSAGMAGNESPPGGLDYGTAGSTGTAGSVGAGTTGTGTGTGTTSDKLGKVKERARELQSTLADRLDAGAEKLRQRGQSAHLAGTTGTADVSVASNERMTQMQDSVARGMHKSADWLRNGDLRGDIEKQVRENPGRTLLIALGVGYVLGKAFRNNR